MRSLDWKGLLFAVLLAAGGFWLLRPGSGSGIEGRTAAFAARTQAVLPQPMADGSIARAARAEGRTLVLTIEGQQAWAPAMTDESMRDTLALDLCSQFELRQLIAAGAQVRIESRTAAAEALPPLTVDRCPGA